jgi:hypothetical protein
MSMLSYPHAVVTFAGSSAVADLGSYRASKIDAPDAEGAGALLHAELLAEARAKIAEAADVFGLADEWLAADWAEAVE